MRLTHFFIDRPIFATVLSIFVTLARSRRARDPAGRAVSGDRAADGAGHHLLSRRFRRDGRPHRRDAARAADQRRREHALHEQPIDRRRQAHDHGDVPDRHRSQRRADADAEPRAGRACRACPRTCSAWACRCARRRPASCWRVHLYSPDKSRDTLYLSNYATLHVKDVLARLPGVGDVQFQGAREYAMRIWLDPDKVAAHDLNASEVLAALRAQNLQVSAGVLNQPPIAGRRGLSDQRRDARPAVDARAVRRHRAEVRRRGPRDAPARHRPRRGRRRRLRHRRPTWTAATRHAAADLRPARRQLARGRARGAGDDAGAGEGFPARRRLQDHLRSDDLHRASRSTRSSSRSSSRSCWWSASCSCSCRAGAPTIIPVIAIPVSLVGTFTILSALGISLNNLSLFGLVLAVGIVVDDAIVVVENVERNMRAACRPRRPRIAPWTRSAAR